MGCRAGADSRSSGYSGLGGGLHRASTPPSPTARVADPCSGRPLVMSLQEWLSAPSVSCRALRFCSLSGWQRCRLGFCFLVSLERDKSLRLLATVVGYSIRARNRRQPGNHLTPGERQTPKQPLHSAILSVCVRACMPIPTATLMYMYGHTHITSHAFRLGFP